MLLEFDRFWLLTSTTYGTWLPGDERGFVSNVADGPGPEVRHNIPGTPYDADMPGLVHSSLATLKGPPVQFSSAMAAQTLHQFLETADHRDWLLCAVAVMATHFHSVVGVPGDPDPDHLLRDFKSYASRRLNTHFPRPESGTWWTTGGSKRKLPNEAAVHAGVRYVKNQPSPLVIWVNPLFTDDNLKM